MRAGNLASGRYSPGQVPAKTEALAAFIAGELARIAATFDLIALGHLDASYAAPAKPREGDIRLVDGVLWNPGSGAGVYAYYGGAWNRLG